LCFDADGRLVREQLATGRGVNFSRDSAGQVTLIESDDPPGAGAAKKLILVWGAQSRGGASWGATRRVAYIVDEENREIRFSYDSSSGQYLTSVQRFASASATSPLARTDFSWATGSGTSSQVVAQVARWVYADDPHDGDSDALKSVWDVTYDAYNRVQSVTQVGTEQRSIGSGGETIPAVADTITAFTYAAPGGGAPATAVVKTTVSRGTSANGSLFGSRVHYEDWLGRARRVEYPQESGATHRRVDLASYDGGGHLTSTETSRREPISTGSVIAGDVTTYEFDGDDLVEEVVDHAAGDSSGVPDTSVEYSSFNVDGLPERVVERRVTFIPLHVYAVDVCVDSQAAQGTFRVTSVTGDAMSAAEVPAWPSSGTVASGNVTFTKTSCAPTPTTVASSLVYDDGVVTDELVDGEKSSNGDDREGGVLTCTEYNAGGDITRSYEVKRSSEDVASCSDTDFASSDIEPGSETIYTYDADGWLDEIQTADSVTKYDFDATGLEERTELVTGGSSADNVVTTRSYDEMGREGCVRNSVSEA
jgi:hypothetical protein